MILSRKDSAVRRRRIEAVESTDECDTTSLILTSLSIILVAFFVYLCQIAGPDEARQRRVLAELRSQFFGSIAGLTEHTTAGKDNSNDEAQMLESAGFSIEKLENGFLARAPHGTAFTRDYRIQPHIVEALKGLASSLLANAANLSFTVYADEQSLVELHSGALDQALGRQTSVQRLLLDLGFPENSTSCFAALGTVNAELVVELRRQHHAQRG